MCENQECSITVIGQLLTDTLANLLFIMASCSLWQMKWLPGWAPELLYAVVLGLSPLLRCTISLGSSRSRHGEVCPLLTFGKDSTSTCPRMLKSRTPNRCITLSTHSQTTLS